MDIVFTSLIELVSSPTSMGLLLLAIPIGMFFGAVPGLGGKLGIALLIPFVFGMDMIPGAVFLLSMHAVVHTGGSIPSILFGVPGTLWARGGEEAVARARPLPHRLPGSCASRFL